MKRVVTRFLGDIGSRRSIYEEAIVDDYRRCGGENIPPIKYITYRTGYIPWPPSPAKKNDCQDALPPVKRDSGPAG